MSSNRKDYEENYKQNIFATYLQNEIIERFYVWSKDPELRKKSIDDFWKHINEPYHGSNVKITEDNVRNIYGLVNLGYALLCCPKELNYIRKIPKDKNLQTDYDIIVIITERSKQKNILSNEELIRFMRNSISHANCTFNSELVTFKGANYKKFIDPSTKEFDYLIKITPQKYKELLYYLADVSNNLISTEDSEHI